MFPNALSPWDLGSVIVDDFSGGYRRNVPDGADLRIGSVADPAFVDTLFAETRIDHVFHLAAYAAEVLSHFIRRHNYDVNSLWKHQPDQRFAPP